MILRRGSHSGSPGGSLEELVYALAEPGHSCLTERLWIARRARDAGFLASPGLYLAALGSVTRRCEAWLATGAASEADRVTLEQLLAEVAAEARATESAHARDSA